MNGKMVLEGNQKKVAQYLSRNGGASHSEIMDGTGLAASSVSRATDKLEGYEIIEDVDKRPNKTNYQLVDSVDIRTEMQMGSFLSKTTISQLIGVILLVIYLGIVGSPSNRAVLFFAGFITIIPTVVYTFYESLDQKVYAVERT